MINLEKRKCADITFKDDQLKTVGLFTKFMISH